MIITRFLAIVSDYMEEKNIMCKENQDAQLRVEMGLSVPSLTLSSLPSRQVLGSWKFVGYNTVSQMFLAHGTLSVSVTFFMSFLGRREYLSFPFTKLLGPSNLVTIYVLIIL